MAEYGGVPAEFDPERDRLLEKLDKFDKELDGHWGKWVTESKIWYDMVAGEQWDTDALADFAIDQRNPIVINNVDPMVSAISGAEITNRQTVKFSPRELGDVQVNELFTGAVEWSRDECDASDEESQAFRDAVICGLGVTETRMDYDDDPEGMVAIERIDPLEVAVDPRARKANFVDAKYFRRKRLFSCEEAEILFPSLYSTAPYEKNIENPHDASPGTQYRKDGDSTVPAGMVEICEYQWREVEAVVRVNDPVQNKVIDLDRKQVDKLTQAGVDPQIDLQGVRMKRTKWMRAFRAGPSVVQDALPDGEFTYKFVTGKLDRNKGTPYGVVRAMVDPQRWSNKFLANIDRIITVNAKGGIIAEEDAFVDPRKAQEEWARADSMIFTANDALAKGRIQPKPPQPYPQGMDRLFQLATEAIPRVTGVNAEMLGMADRDQPGVLEYQRKQAAYGVLSIFFDSLKRYRKLQGRLHLKLISKYMSDGRLIRITNMQGAEQYVPLVHDPNVLKFDVVVDEAPAGPNQVERTWQALIAAAPMLKNLLTLGLPPEVILDILDYSPLPSSLVAKLREKMTQMQQMQAQQMQQQAQLAQQMQQIQVAGEAAKVGKTQADTALSHAKAQGQQVENALKPQEMALQARDQEMNYQQAAWDRQNAVEQADRDSHEREKDRHFQASTKERDRSFQAQDRQQERMHKAGEAERGRMHEQREGGEQRNHDMRREQMQRAAREREAMLRAQQQQQRRPN